LSPVTRGTGAKLSTSGNRYRSVDRLAARGSVHALNVLRARARSERESDVVEQARHFMNLAMSTKLRKKKKPSR
jgi:hypothetical protein